MPTYEQARRQAAVDRRNGLMPSQIQRRDDGDELWAAFRQAIGGSSWTWTHVRMFVAGWDAGQRDRAA